MILWLSVLCIVLLVLFIRQSVRLTKALNDVAALEAANKWYDMRMKLLNVETHTRA